MTDNNKCRCHSHHLFLQFLYQLTVITNKNRFIPSVLLSVCIATRNKKGFIPPIPIQISACVVTNENGFIPSFLYQVTVCVATNEKHARRLYCDHIMLHRRCPPIVILQHVNVWNNMWNNRLENRPHGNI